MKKILIAFFSLGLAFSIGSTLGEANSVTYTISARIPQIIGVNYFPEITTEESDLSNLAETSTYRESNNLEKYTEQRLKSDEPYVLITYVAK